jgi:hypothetical protein
LFLYNYVLLQQLQNDETKERVLLFQATADATRATKLNPQHVCALILRGWFENSEKVRKRFWPVLLAQANFDCGGGPQPRRGGGGCWDHATTEKNYICEASSVLSVLLQA